MFRYRTIYEDSYRYYTEHGISPMPAMERAQEDAFLGVSLDIILTLLVAAAMGGVMGWLVKVIVRPVRTTLLRLEVTSFVKLADVATRLGPVCIGFLVGGSFFLRRALRE